MQTIGNHQSELPASALSSEVTNDLPSLARPPQAHLSTNASAGVQRPIHMLRSPSFNPPAFEDEAPPPALETPPPIYDDVFGTPSHDGLADYFTRYDCSLFFPARLSPQPIYLAKQSTDSPHRREAEEHTDDEETDDEDAYRASSRGRVNLPLTPGGRVNRSMDLDRREFMSMQLQAVNLRNSTIVSNAARMSNEQVLGSETPPSP